MRELMRWEECQRIHVKKVEIDRDRINSILKMSRIRLDMLRETKVDDNRASVIASDYYEIIKELLVAFMLKNGLKSDNHDCLISYFRHKNPEREYESKMMHELKDIRNKAMYEGRFIRQDFISRNKLEFDHIIKLLNEMIR